MATTQADRFELAGDGIAVRYSTSSFAGPPQLRYAGREGELSFTGADIETTPSPLGTEVTVTLASVPDLHTTTLTLILPFVEVPIAGDVSFATLAIVTTISETTGEPAAGASQTYEAIVLHGRASSSN